MVEVVIDGIRLDGVTAECHYERFLQKGEVVFYRMST